MSPSGSLVAQAIAELRSLVDKLEASGEVLFVRTEHVTPNPHLRHQEVMFSTIQKVVGPDVLLLGTALFAKGARQMLPSTHLTALRHVKHYDDCSALFDAQSIVAESLPAESQFELTAGQQLSASDRTFSWFLM